MAQGFEDHLIAEMSSRRRIIVGSRYSVRRSNLTPSIIAGIEREKVIFDFGEFFYPSSTSPIQTIQVDVLVDSGVDPDPESRMLGLPVLMNSITTGAVHLGVRVLFGNMLAGVVYIIRCTVETLDGHQLVTEARWPCVAVP